MSIIVKSNNSNKTALSTSDILDKLYPIGSVYFTVNDNNPGNFLGGTWEQFGQGRTLIGVGTGTDSNNKSVEFKSDRTGGEYAHSISVNEIPSHTHSISISGTTGGNSIGHTHSYTRASSVQGHTLSDTEIPRHAHTIPAGVSVEEAKGYGLSSNGGFCDRVLVSGRLMRASSVGSSGSHSHGLNTTTDTSTGESQNHTHTFSYSGNTGDINDKASSMLNMMQPYITIYFWKRTK